ncbi:MAG: type II toxin-antitoxin system prevent-host-death family antitoxin [Sumerlaeia bacterium]
MEKTISTRDLRATVGEIINTVRLRGDTYLVEQRGKPQAALVPLHIYEAYQNNRKRLVELMDTVAERNADRDPEEIEAAIDEAVAEVRAGRRAAKAPQTPEAR